MGGHGTDTIARDIAGSDEPSRALLLRPMPRNPRVRLSQGQVENRWKEVRMLEPSHPASVTMHSSAGPAS